MEEIVEHLREPHRVYAISFENGMHKRLVMVHVARPVSFKTVCVTFILNNIELTVEKTGEKLQTSLITGIQKVPNQNIPEYELTLDGLLKEIIK